MQHARLSIDPAYRIGDIDPRLWGGLVEHVGRNLYGGIYEPGHPTADAQGFRGDVLAILRDLEVPLYRYPGGCFVSQYDWEDGIGPRAERKPTLDLAWRTVEPNEVGVDEFVPWTRRAGGDTFMVVNMGTRGANAARNLVEYCNHPSGSPWSDRRIANGAREPHGVTVWGLGNEMDSPNEIGAKTADEYGRLAYESAKLMRRVDPGIEIVACGTTNARMPTYPGYAATVLEHAYDVVDHLAIHEYYGNAEDDLPTYLARSLEMDEYIEAHVAACDYVRARMRRRKRMMLSFDEWNISWYHSQEHDSQIPPWTTAPPFMEDIFTFEDALVLGCMGISLLRHADRVKIGAMSTIVNNVGVLMTVDGGIVWRQTTFFPYADLCRYARGVALDVQVTAPHYETSTHGPVPLVTAGAALDEATGRVTLFAVNRGTDGHLPAEADLRGFGDLEVAEHRVLVHRDPKARNTADRPETVAPHSRGGASVVDGRLTAELPPLSWNVIRLAPRAD